MSALPDAKHERFCREYIIDYNGTQAAIRAGYSEKSARTTASRLLANDNILSRVRELQSEQCKRLAIDADWVILRAKEMLDRCLEKTPVMEWDAGARCFMPNGEWQFDSKGAGKALELIGKVLNLFSEKVDVSGGVTVVFAGEDRLED